MTLLGFHPVIKQHHIWVPKLVCYVPHLSFRSKLLDNGRTNVAVITVTFFLDKYKMTGYKALVMINLKTNL